MSGHMLYKTKHKVLIQLHKFLGNLDVVKIWIWAPGYNIYKQNSGIY